MTSTFSLSTRLFYCLLGVCLGLGGCKSPKGEQEAGATPEDSVIAPLPVSDTVILNDFASSDSLEITPESLPNQQNTPNSIKEPIAKGCGYAHFIHRLHPDDLVYPFAKENSEIWIYPELFSVSGARLSGNNRANAFGISFPVWDPQSFEECPDFVYPFPPGSMHFYRLSKQKQAALMSKNMTVGNYFHLAGDQIYGSLTREMTVIFDSLPEGENWEKFMDVAGRAPAPEIKDGGSVGYYSVAKAKSYQAQSIIQFAKNLRNLQGVRKVEMSWRHNIEPVME